ncbi:alpha-amylase [Methylobacterium gregans]|uniref:Cyclomaltodextrinase n=1 Tax=Methylobacterium gregans TaxID=374424 RepID=A0AA37HV44_9HYPH|nr:alpha-amylase family protein [Methylobacterium gregans]MDQ0523760.1 cyclomaltodextrinase [Methylobacterium gregans]GJD81217.1 Cyclomaltodextrinase [Methylobacterium gregans]GLS54796.1 alpha-amylase [Methylobacterium gregans]
MAAWIETTLWWHVYPLGFVGAPRAAPEQAEPVPRLRRLEAWLDYAAEMGATGLALGPIFAASTHGYDTIDHLRIDPRLGDDADFDALVAAARARGLRLLLDGVFNHVGRDFPAFAEVLRLGPEAPRAHWFRLSWPRGPGAEPDYACFEGHRQLVALNHDEPEVATYVEGVMTHWLARGADGWRLDAAYAVPPAFWARILPRVRATHPEAYLVGEVIHGDYAGFVAESGLDAVTQYELWKAIWSALNDRNLYELAHALERHNGFLDRFVPLTFVGNHDVTRIASRLANPRHLGAALAVLFTCGGVPAIYAGDEQGFVGIKEERAGGDDAIRPEFPATPAELPAEGWPLYRLHRELAGLRRAHPWLHRARIRIDHLANRQMVACPQADGQGLLLALNLDDAPAALPAPRGRAVEAGDGQVIDPGAAGARVLVPPHAWAVLSFA